MKHGFMYLMAIIDIHSRYVLNWSISNTMDKNWCVSVLTETISMWGTPEIFNADQGSQFTSIDFTNVLKENEIKISMDGKGRAIDNIYIERLWRSIKYENIYLNAYETGLNLYKGLDTYFKEYNTLRPHQSLNYQTPERILRNAA